MCVFLCVYVHNKDLNKVFFTFGPNFVILAWMGQEVSHGKVRYWDTHTMQKIPGTKQEIAKSVL